MSAYKIQHKDSGLFISTSATSRFGILYMYLNDYKLKVYGGRFNPFTKNGRVWSTKKGAEKTLDIINEYIPNECIIKELK